MPWTSPLTTAVALLGGVAIGAIYAAHLGFAEDVKIYEYIEEHSTREYRGLAPTFTPLQLFVSAHAHAAVALAVVAASPYYMGVVLIFGLGLTVPLLFPLAVFTALSSKSRYSLFSLLVDPQV